MTDTKMTNQLELRWVQRTGADGRPRMEARWVTTHQVAITQTHAAA